MPVVLQARLDKVAEAGLPIWISELDVQESDVNTRANRYENLVRLFFAHEAVEGLLLWGFWDGAHWCSDCVLAEGSSVTVRDSLLKPDAHRQEMQGLPTESCSSQ